MTEKVSYECAECGKALTAHREPCPFCGSTRRKIYLLLEDEIKVGDSLSGVAKIDEMESSANPTRHKSREAEYFLSKMKKAFEDSDKFAYNHSAFLSAARSITFYMQKQYTRCNGFSEWYSSIVEKMSDDPELQYLKKVRNEDIHEETVQTGATREISFGVSVVFGEAQPKSDQVKETERSPKQSSPKTIRRFYPMFGKIDVIEFGENQLKKLNKIVEECEKKFLGERAGD